MIPKKSLDSVLDKSIILRITDPNDNAKSISVQCAPLRSELPKPGWEIDHHAPKSPTSLLSYSRWIAGDEIGSHNMSEKKKNSPPRAADKHVVWLAPTQKC